VGEDGGRNEGEDGNEAEHGYLRSVSENSCMVWVCKTCPMSGES
jgi:hypothetical protein